MFAPLSNNVLTPDISRPTAELEDPVSIARIYRIDHIGISAYLVALAAWQRGLRVTFHYEVASKSPRFARSLASASRGEFFSVSDGQKTHFFLRTLGDLTSREASALCDNKQATKQRLIAAGVPVPDGILVDRTALDEVALGTFLQRSAIERFHIKPLVGSLGIGAHGHLSRDAVRSCIADHKDQQLLVEEHMPGMHLRVMVVDGLYVGTFFLINLKVIGDGVSSVAELIEQKRSARRHKALYPSAVIPFADDEKENLAAQGLNQDSIPKIGQIVHINKALQLAQGADVIDVTDTCSYRARELAIRACAAVSVPVGGVDLLIDEETGQHVVLEVNQCPMIKANAFPFYTASPGNRVAESVIDFYFPSSVNNRRLTRASFDFMRVCDMLKSGAVAELSLPVLNANWDHKKVRLKGMAVEQDTQDKVRALAERYGVHIDILRLNGQDVLIDALGPSDLCEAFVNRLQRTAASLAQ